jgi:trans-aconitate methyltransferase
MSKRETISEFYARTSTLPTSEQTKQFLDKICNQGTILDFGCGSGRWAAAFRRDRPDITIDLVDRNLDQAPLLVKEWKGARYHQSFESFRPEKSYDGMWASASLFFLPPAAFTEVLATLAEALTMGAPFYFDMVAPCKPINFYGMNPDAIHAALLAVDIHVDAISTRPELYGIDKMEIETHYVHAHKG